MYADVHECTCYFLCNYDVINPKIARPVHYGWLLMAPPGWTPIAGSAMGSRRWQRRFFVLYELGNLNWSLDDEAGTDPAGTLDLNKPYTITKDQFFIFTILTELRPIFELFLNSDERRMKRLICRIQFQSPHALIPTRKRLSGPSHAKTAFFGIAPYKKWCPIQKNDKNSKLVGIKCW